MSTKTYKPVLNLKELQEMILVYSLAKVPFFYEGPPGVGKSAITAAIAECFADPAILRQRYPAFGRTADSLQKRKFLDWNRCSYQQRIDAIKNAKDYFMFIDQRLGDKNETDLRGIMSMQRNEVGGLDLAPPLFALAISAPDAAGILFFDELPNAAENVAAMAYQIIHDRVVAERSLSPGIIIMSAGNCPEHAPGLVRQMPLPLADRFGEVAVKSSADEFIAWASGKTTVNSERASLKIRTRDPEERKAMPIRPEVIGTLSCYPKILESNVYDGAMKLTTERGLERLSKLVDALPEAVGDNLFQNIACSAVGKEFASNFVSYIKFRSKINIKEFLDDPADWLQRHNKDHYAKVALSEYLASEFPMGDKAEDAKARKIFYDGYTKLPGDCRGLFISTVNSRNGADEQKKRKFWAMVRSPKENLFTDAATAASISTIAASLQI